MHNFTLDNLTKDCRASEILKIETFARFCLTSISQQEYHVCMTDTYKSQDFNPLLIDSLLHPLAQPIRQLLTREGRRELNQILIDDEENILQALEAGVEIESVYYAGEEVISEAFERISLPERPSTRSQNVRPRSFLKMIRSRVSLPSPKRPGPNVWKC